jgi:tRNA threonylcarbamoyladenosine biosynthesis protein TsaE
MLPEPIELALPTRRATTHLGQRIARVLSGGDLVILSGALGAGKTFLVRALCRELGVPARVRVTSPTFTLVHEHRAKLPIVHADLYRLETAAAVRELGLDSLRDDGRLLLVEWGEPYLELLGRDALVVELSLTPRRATLRATGPGSAKVLQALAR